MPSPSNPARFPERDAWLRFFIALGGLSAAFAAAVFSSVTREAGNLWATAVLASLALVLAGVVRLATVSYLARRVALARVRDKFDYDVTRAGVVYIGLALLIGIAALNTGNNLLFLIVSVMLAAVIVSGLISGLVLSGLELEIMLPEHVFAHSKVRGRVLLRNCRRIIPSY